MSDLADHLRVTYLVAADPAHVEARAEALLLEQAVELPREAVRDPWVREHILGIVEDIEPAGPGRFRVTIAHPAATTAGDPAQLLNVLFGNSSLQPDVVLADVALPASAAARLGGPRFGLDAWRALTGAHGRPLLATALKPMGLPPERIAGLCATFARAGLDVIKDDHGLADHPFCPFAARVAACLDAVARAADATGREALYVPNLVGTPDAVRRQLDLARRLGARAVMVAPMLLGLPFLAELAASAGVPILAHPSFAGVLRAEEPALLGTLFRHFGADAVIFPHHGGRFAYSRATCLALADALRGARPGVRAALPVPAGGIALERVAAVLGDYGSDAMLLIGGSLYLAGDALLDRTRDLVDQVAALARAAA